jgi:quaternary ammonium compound-resistance protein SugE
MAWVYLTVAGILEIIWASAMKQSNGFTKLWPSIITITAMVISFWLLSIAMKVLPLGTAYVVWVGIGAVGAFMAGIFFFDEQTNIMRVLAAGFIVLGIVLMKFSDSTQVVETIQ